MRKKGACLIYPISTELSNALPLSAIYTFGPYASISQRTLIDANGTTIKALYVTSEQTTNIGLTTQTHIPKAWTEPWTQAKKNQFNYRVIKEAAAYFPILNHFIKTFNTLIEFEQENPGLINERLELDKVGLNASRINDWGKAEVNQLISQAQAYFHEHEVNPNSIQQWVKELQDKQSAPFPRLNRLWFQNNENQEANQDLRQSHNDNDYVLFVKLKLKERPNAQTADTTLLNRLDTTSLFFLIQGIQSYPQYTLKLKTGYVRSAKTHIQENNLARFLNADASTFKRYDPDAFVRFLSIWAPLIIAPATKFTYAPAVAHIVKQKMDLESAISKLAKGDYKGPTKHKKLLECLCRKIIRDSHRQMVKKARADSNRNDNKSRAIESQMGKSRQSEKMKSSNPELRLKISFYIKKIEPYLNGKNHHTLATTVLIRTLCHSLWTSLNRISQHDNRFTTSEGSSQYRR